MRHREKKTSEDLIAHFQKRCKERLGYVLKQRNLKKEMSNKTDLFKNIGSQSNTRTYWKINRCGTDYVLVYDKPRHCFVTIMYYNEWMQNRRPDLSFQINHPEYIKDGIE